MLSLCIVIPCYNESERLPVNALRAFAEAHAHIHFLLVNDGSSDATAAVIDQLQAKFPKHFTAYHLAKNSGKAEAVRQGLNQAISQGSFDWIGYFDADLATPLEELLNMQEVIALQRPYQAILGSRIKRMGAKITRNPLRHYVGRVFATFASITLNLPIYDTQCGAKIFKKELLSGIIEKPFVSSWLFDVELLGRIRNVHGLQKTEAILYEMPLQQWIDIGGSRIKLKHLFKLPFEFLKLHRTINRY